MNIFIETKIKMEKIVLKMKGADGKNKKFILPTKDNYQITSLIQFYGLNDYKLINVSQLHDVA